MNCETCRDWLLNADDWGAAPGEIASHVAQCASCQECRTDLADLERRWRGLPLPVAAETSKQAFLARLANPASPNLPTPAKRIRRWGPARWAVAALLFIGLGAGVLFVLPEREIAAHSDLLDQFDRLEPRHERGRPRPSSANAFSMKRTMP